MTALGPRASQHQIDLPARVRQDGSKDAETIPSPAPEAFPSSCAHGEFSTARFDGVDQRSQEGPQLSLCRLTIEQRLAPFTQLG